MINNPQRATRTRRSHLEVRTEMGCASSSSSSTPAVQFGGALKVVAWGVLGEAMGSSPWETKPVAPKPDKDCVIVDPASVRINSPNFTPGSAGGAAGAIYRFLGIAENDNFPPDVLCYLKVPGDATYKRYGHPNALHVIHVIGPDFNDLQLGRSAAVEALAQCYHNVLKLAAAQGRPLLRLVPVSSGIYAGPFKSEMAEMTAEALHTGFRMLQPSEQSELAPNAGRRIELCVFNPDETKAFKRAIERAFAMPLAQ